MQNTVFKNNGIFLCLLFIIVLLMFPTIGSAKVNASSAPKTGFEIRNDGSWTTHQEELNFLGELSEQSDRLEYEQVGTSGEGRPLHLVKVSTPKPDSNAEIASGRNILIMGTFHGNEPSGREMTLKLMRDLAYTDDPTLIALMEKATVLFIPTVNPDGREANLRRNKDDFDLNRDAIKLKTPEVQTVAKIQQQYKPDIILDAHERMSGPNMSLLGNLNLNVDKNLQQLNQELIDNYMFPDLKDAGFTVDYYPPGAAPTNTRSMSGLKHSIGVLTEATWENDPQTRVDAQMEAAHSVLQFYDRRFEDVANVVTDAPINKRNTGENRSEPFYLEGMVGSLPNENATLNPPPCGYLINERQKEQISRQIDLFSLQTEKVKNGYFVPMSQSMMTVIPFIMDQRSDLKLVNGLAINDCTELGEAEPPSAPIPQQFQTDFTEYKAGKQPNDWTSPWKDSSWSVKKNPERLEHMVTSGGDRRLLTWDESGEVHGDVEVSTLVRANNVGSLFEVHLHGSGETGKENSYYLDVSKKHDKATIRISRLLGGRNTILNEVILPFDVDIDTWYNVVFQRKGNTLNGKVWTYGEEEPEDWQVTVEADMYIDFGHVGVGNKSTGMMNDWKYFSVGTYGESAERAPTDLMQGLDKSILQRRINEIKERNLNEKDFSSTSWNNLQTALTKAESVFNQSHTTQKEIDRAVAQLYQAYLALSAHFSTRFSEYDLGNTPSDWSVLWRDSNWTVKNKPHRLAHFVTDGGGRRVLTWDKAGIINGDVELSALVKAKDNGTTMFQLHLQSSGAKGSENSYYLDLRTNGDVRINRNQNGNFKVLKSKAVSFTPKSDVWYEVLFKREGTSLKGKVWPYGEKEPQDWQVEVADDQFVKGKVGVGHVSSGVTNEWAFFGVGSRDMSAPRVPKNIIIDTTLLEKRIVEIESSLRKSDYTKNSWLTLQNALRDAKKIIEQPDITQQIVNEALQEINRAYNALQTTSTAFSTDFSSYEAGEAPSDWSTLWKESAWTIKENPNRLEHVVTDGGGRRVLTWDKVGDIAGDVEVSSVVKTNTEGRTMFQLHLYGSGSENNETSYYLDLRDNGYIRINRNLNASFKVLQSEAFPYPTEKDTWYNVVFKREGAMLKGKAWPFAEKEPDNWQIEIKDDSLNNGKVGIGHVSSGIVNEWAYYSIGTRDKSAPRAPLNLFDRENVDTSALHDKIVAIQKEKLHADDYTDASWDNLQKALTTAQDVLEDNDTTQEEVNRALATLTDAYENLQEKITQEVVLDTSALQEKINAIRNKNLKKDAYTEASWNNLQNALAAAQDVLENNDATQSDIDEAFKDVSIAFENLEKQINGPPKEEKPSKQEQEKNNIAGEEKQSGDKLPSTSTTSYNLILAGFILITLSFIFWFHDRRRQG